MFPPKTNKWANVISSGITENAPIRPSNVHSMPHKRASEDVRIRSPYRSRIRIASCERRFSRPVSPKSTSGQPQRIQIRRYARYATATRKIVINARRGRGVGQRSISRTTANQVITVPGSPPCRGTTPVRRRGRRRSARRPDIPSIGACIGEGFPRPVLSELTRALPFETIPARREIR